MQGLPVAGGGVRCRADLGLWDGGAGWARFCAAMGAGGHQGLRSKVASRGKETPKSNARKHTGTHTYIYIYIYIYMLIYGFCMGDALGCWRGDVGWCWAAEFKHTYIHIRHTETIITL